MIIYEFLAAFKEKFDDAIDKDVLVYFKGKNGFVDCHYLPKIAKEEIKKVLIIGDKPVDVLHKNLKMELFLQHPLMEKNMNMKVHMIQNGKMSSI